MYFYLNNSINKKIISSFTIVAIFSGGLFLFFLNKDIFKNYKSYYFQSYSYVIPYRIARLVNASKPLHVSGTTATTTQYAESVPILLYHGVLGGATDSTEGEATNIDLKTFWDQMRTLKENGWQTITMKDFYDFKLGVKKLPPKSFMITFDDGRKDSYYPANPILKALGFHAVMFVIDQYSLEEDSNYYLSKAELSQMAESKEWELQSHGYSSHSVYPIDADDNKAHFFSNKLWLQDLGRIETEEEFTARVTSDLTKSKKGLEDSFHLPVLGFAFPFGDYGQGNTNFPDAESYVVPTVLNIFPMAFYQYSSIYRYSENYAEPANLNMKFMVKRMGMSPGLTGAKLLQNFKSGSSKNLPFNASFNTEDGWINTDWGTVSLKDNTATFESLTDSTGSMAILDGSGVWTDYTISADVRWEKGSNIYLVGRYQNDNNLAMCNFNKNRVHVEQIVNSESRVIAGVEHVFDPGNAEFNISMKIKGREVSCAINGQVISSTSFLDESLSHGGVGIKIWDSIKHNSKLNIYKFDVEPL